MRCIPPEGDDADAAAAVECEAEAAEMPPEECSDWWSERADPGPAGGSCDFSLLPLPVLRTSCCLMVGIYAIVSGDSLPSLRCVTVSFHLLLTSASSASSCCGHNCFSLILERFRSYATCRSCRKSILSVDFTKPACSLFFGAPARKHRRKHHHSFSPACSATTRTSSY